MSTEQRSSSLTPLQALYFLNGPFPERCATNLAAKLGTADEKSSIQQSFLTIWGRPATAVEMDRSLGFLHTASDALATHEGAGADAKQKALAEFIKAMYASNEFMFVE